ncbi:Acetoacetate decarboxylase [Gemmatirosa kalamazoonensis]|uniref:Acetoacetate decarboxylase n=1 Tax=Gemmatirosa kalamazoonensis TaxID=861299 RepID=W0RQK5_9BACT|nr:acetoacetate decarboxylase family protein [Gemmatirosa kalamazoonensis]AHG91823.1 Acetoacetate decarboxylase [Gemmatirosa kalamazoonensis]
MTMLPRRLRDQTGRHALVDGIPFTLPVHSERTPALMAAFPIDADRAAVMLPGNELHAFRWRGHGLLVVTVVDYRVTSIGKYIEFSIAIACTRGRRPAPPLLPLVFQKTYGLGQYVVDLPVSTEVSVKGGKGIWGMPKHQASLDFVIEEHAVSSQYDLDGRLAMRIEVEQPRGLRVPLFNLPAANYCAFRGMLYKSYIYFTGHLGMTLGGAGKARLTLGDQPRMRALRELGIGSDPVFTAFFPSTHGTLDDHYECWFLSYDRLPVQQPEGMESVVNLGLGETWPESPHRDTAATPRTR